MNIYDPPLPILQIEADGGSSDFLPTQGQAAGCLRAFNNPSGQMSACPKGVVSRARWQTALIATLQGGRTFPLPSQFSWVVVVVGGGAAANPTVSRLKDGRNQGVFIC